MAFPINVAGGDGVDSGSFSGPFVHGSDWYVLSNMFTASALNVYKSTDSGQTWTGIQLGLGPFDPTIGGRFFDIKLSLDGTEIVTVWYDSPGLKVQRFSMVTDTWGAASTGGGNSDVGSGDDLTEDSRVRMVLASNGDIFAFYAEWLTTNQTINYMKFSGGVWSADTVLVTSSGTIFNYIASAFQDSNGLMHIYYRKAPSDNVPAALYHISLTTGGVAGTENAIDLTTRSFPTGSSFEFNGFQNIIWYNSSSLTGVWTSDGLGSTPTWSFTLLNTLALPSSIDIGPQQTSAGSPHYGAKGFGFVDGGIAHVIWQTTNGQAGGYTINRIYESTNSGSGWSAPVLLFDEFAVHTVPVPKLFGLTAAVVGGDLVVFSDINCNGLYFVAQEAITPNPLTIICDDPPPALQGVPYSHFFPASGGTPPYTFSITAGALPTGLSLNASTGEVSGTVIGFDDATCFTITVTDSNHTTVAFTSKASGDWDSAGQTTWNEVGVPGFDDTALISHTVTLTASAGIGDGSTGALTIDSSGILVIADDQVLTVQGSVDNSGSIDLGTGASVEFGSGSGPGVSASVTCCIDEPPLPSVICDDPPDALQGEPYSHFFPASSGTPPYTWSITVGALPDGLTLNASTGEVSGTPTVRGTFVFTVTVTDSLGQSSSVTCSITVIATPGHDCPDEDIGGPG